MSTRPAPDTELDSEVFGVPVDWATLSSEEQAFLQEGIDDLDRGAFVSHAEMKLEFKRMREKYARK
ncbi:hypothetical protein [Sandarakinorhabdus glacialis]|nr:hypothetical protein [Polymorphobacter glacialis]